MILIDLSAAAALAPADPEERAGAEGMERGPRRETEEETGRRRRGTRGRRRRRRRKKKKKTVEWHRGEKRRIQRVASCHALAPGEGDRSQTGMQDACVGSQPPRLAKVRPFATGREFLFKDVSSSLPVCYLFQNTKCKTCVLLCQ